MNTKKLVRLAAAAGLAVATLPAALQGSVNAQSVNQPFTTRIYVQNPNTAAATAIINFYPELSGTAEPTVVNLNLNANGSAEVLVGSLSLSSPWKGSAVISADQNVVAASIQVPPTGYGHIMANAFTAADATSNLFLTTFLGAGNPTNAVSLFAVQNTEGEPINIRARFILPNGTVVATPTLTLPAYASKFFDGNNAGSIGSGYANPFNGSVVVTATKVSDGTPAMIVGASEEKRTEATGLFRFQAYGFEAIPQSAGATAIYMPTALCRFGAGDPTTFFAIQNMSFTTPTVVTVTYTAGPNQPSAVVNTVQPLAKWSVNPCQSNGSLSYSGAAVIQSSTSPIAAVGKASQQVGTNARYTTAYLAQATSSNRLAVPYVRWNPSANTGFRSFIAIQNIGGSSIASGQLTVRYYAPDGTLVNTCTSAVAMASGAKLNSNVAGAFAGGTNFSCTTVQPSNGSGYTFSGSAVVEGPAGSSLLAVIRNSPDAATAQIHTEDFNAISLP
jgi:hypothetical protein